MKNFPLQAWLNYYSGQFRNERTKVVEPGYELFLILLANICSDKLSMSSSDALTMIKDAIPNSYVLNQNGNSIICLVTPNLKAQFPVPMPFPITN